MKKTIFILMALLTSLMCNAQQSWDFTATNANDITALKAATTEWSYTESIDRYENIKPINGFLTAGGTVLQTTQGLKFKSAEKKLRIDVNKRVQLAGKNIEITIPSLKKGQTVTISFASTGNTVLTLDNLVNLENTSGMLGRVVDEDRLENLVASLEGNLKELQEFIRRMDEAVSGAKIPESAAAFRGSADKVAESVSSLQQASSAVSNGQQELSNTLFKLNQAIDSLRMLIEYIESDPGSLLRGKTRPNEKK